ILLGECWLLARLGGERRTLRQLLAIDVAPLPAGPAAVRSRRIGRPALAALVVLMAAVVPARALPQRAELRPTRADFAEFPLRLGACNGRRQPLEALYLDTLKLDDYVLADFVMPHAVTEPSAGADRVNLYVAYYASQRTGQSAHSPRSCLPGGGWRI